MLCVEGFCKHYGGIPAAHGLSFKLRSGDVLGLVGPNGAGKTTTMSALAGMLPPASGRLTVAGVDVSQQPVEVRRKVAWLPDTPQLFSDLTVEEHLSFTVSAFRLEYDRERVVELLESFDLVEHVRKTAGELSRGMRQKLAICCAYLRDPDVLMFDEPFTGLDPRGIHWLKQSIAERAERGAAVIVSSHLLAMVEDVCTHLLLLDAGEQRFFGPLSEIRGALDSHDELATLEDIFLLATEVRSKTSCDHGTGRTRRSLIKPGVGKR